MKKTITLCLVILMVFTVLASCAAPAKAPVKDKNGRTSASGITA